MHYVGTIREVRGSVVDVFFPGEIPPMLSVLRCGEDQSVVLEVAVHVNERTARAIALTPTQGLAR
ncbi:F0F1 ATP synthase subunit beta, partial [Desulfocurvibacter africanus]